MTTATAASPSKAYRGAGMEGWMARWYTRTRAKDMADFRAQARGIADTLPVGAKVLEVAPGPGFFSIELATLGDFHVSGLDISKSFIEIASENARQAKVEIVFTLGNASAMPFENSSFDLVYCSAAFKNFTEPVKALDEMHRVLKPGGHAVIVDLRKDVSMDEIEQYVKNSGRNGFDAWFTNLAFRHMLIRRAYTRGQMLDMAEQSRFGCCELTLGPIGFEAKFTRPAEVPLAV
jgi:ubiquinone/menaquinone biosynthesis C-methylase UbiE